MIPCGSLTNYQNTWGTTNRNYEEYSAFKLSVESSDEQKGTAQIDIEPTCLTDGVGEEATISATPYTGYVFDSWSDGNRDNPRIISFSADTTVFAYFTDAQHKLFLSCPTECGTVYGSGIYPHGTEVSIRAEGNDGYDFVQWSDGNTDNPRTIIMTEDRSLSAIFGRATALQPPASDACTAQKIIRNGQVLILRNGKTYTLTGQEVR